MERLCFAGIVVWLLVRVQVDWHTKIERVDVSLDENLARDFGLRCEFWEGVPVHAVGQESEASNEELWHEYRWILARTRSMSWRNYGYDRSLVQENETQRCPVLLVGIGKVRET